ncbi:DUF4240 domain-containing protein [Actinokineospora guangxiensis]|uniref:DUF4240 domain-containing protein n=1 Tax=Actinokineospora guangxiensis TaxID=1490288 RepID=A0ABW0EVR1_9PSEU
MGMTRDAFWDLLRRASERPTERERTEYVVTELLRLPAPCTPDFHHHLSAVRVDTAGLRAAGRVILGSALTDDAYWDFGLWLLSLGPGAVERAVTDPDTLADVPKVRALAGGWSADGHPGWGSLADAVPEVADLGCECHLAAPEPRGGPVPPLPRLTALFDSAFPPVRNESDAPVVTVVW